MRRRVLAIRPRHALSSPAARSTLPASAASASPGFGWAIWLAIAYSRRMLLALAGVVRLAPSYVGSRPSRSMDPVRCSRHRGDPLASAPAARRRIGRILLHATSRSDAERARNALILVAFVLVAVAVAVVAVRSSEPRSRCSSARSSQARLAAALVRRPRLRAGAARDKLYGLDLLLSGFTAGLITRQSPEVKVAELFDSKARRGRVRPSSRSSSWSSGSPFSTSTRLFSTAWAPSRGSALLRASSSSSARTPAILFCRGVLPTAESAWRRAAQLHAAAPS